MQWKKKLSVTFAFAIKNNTNSQNAFRIFLQTCRVLTFSYASPSALSNSKRLFLIRAAAKKVPGTRCQV